MSPWCTTGTTARRALSTGPARPAPPLPRALRTGVSGPPFPAAVSRKRGGPVTEPLTWRGQGRSVTSPVGGSAVRTCWVLRQRRVCVLQELVELGGEPVARQRGVRQSARGVVAVARVAAVGRVAHLVEALALVVRDGLARAVRLAR